MMTMIWREVTVLSIAPGVTVYYQLPSFDGNRMNQEAIADIGGAVSLMHAATQRTLLSV